MSDIVERLLQAHEDAFGSPDIDSEYIQAADLIESQRAEIEQVSLSRNHLVNDRNELALALQKTTEALENIAALDYTKAATTGACALAVRIAKEALPTKGTFKCGQCGWEGTGTEGFGTHMCNPRPERGSHVHDWMQSAFGNCDFFCPCGAIKRRETQEVILSEKDTNEFTRASDARGPAQITEKAESSRHQGSDDACAGQDHRAPDPGRLLTEQGRCQHRNRIGDGINTEKCADCGEYLTEKDTP